MGYSKRNKYVLVTWIYKNMADYARDLGKGIFFPHLITELCKRVEIPIEQMDKTMNPPRKLLGNDIFK
ncbi:hypothetical protein Goklo_000634 [Gossypium klotzschianum]|uniref:Uncharacterized protein n=1 Tax=Gossypium klotzschianum TaxID=34286 RepID=A0A7J8VXL8_9ROSI|nr:hypothetical protein [Gossypium klotzschianum]